MFLKETSEHITFNYYAEQTTESVLAFVIEITSDTQDSITGNVYPLDYAAHCNHVRSVSLYPETVLMQYKPHSEEALTALLHRERKEGVYYREECANAYIARVS